MVKKKVLVCLIAIVALLGPGCGIRKIAVAEVLNVEPEVSAEELINRINAFADVKTFSAGAELTVRNYFTGTVGSADQFPAANGQIRLKRPENIRMLVQAPVLHNDVADMTTDGKRFKLAIFYPSDKRRFVRGSNLKEYDRMTEDQIKKTKNSGVSQAGGLVNMRPQHITDAFLLKGAVESEHTEVFREELRQEEDDERPGKKGRRVVKNYYVIYVIEHEEPGHIALRRKYWFDRTQPGVPLVRQQTFENGGGRLASDISYYQWFDLPKSGRRLAKRVIIERHNDGYRLELALDPDSVELNIDLPDKVFELENTEHLEEVDLDAPRRAEPPQPGGAQAANKNQNPSRKTPKVIMRKP